ncbi:hypothetical protein GCM10009854_43550 [Saccharopolyspora halophila]|uniref:Uncharacterized protein n=2 Tax=Saccharopolyspora halophila TaxID=405551 RepID=A0ABN3GTG6_9PSEU
MLRLLRGAVRTWEVCVEAEERRQLLQRPWEESVLHWSWQGDTWVLHGRYPPPDDCWRYGTTSWGWCQGRSDLPGPRDQA